MSLTKFAVHRPVTTLMCSCIIILLGMMSIDKIPKDLLPEFTYPSLTIQAVYEGAGPEEVESQIVEPLEKSISTVPGVERITSYVTEGTCQIVARFSWGVDLTEAANDMRAKLERARKGLPDDIEPPVVRKYNSTDRPIMYLVYKTGTNKEGKEEDLISASSFAEETLMPMLERIEGVAAVRMKGEHRREIQVNLDRQKLQSLDMSVNDVVAALNRENVNQPAGNYEQGNVNLLIRSKGEFQSLDEIGEAIVRSDENTVIRLTDVANIVDGEEERMQRTIVNGKAGLMFYVYKQAGANTVRVSDLIRQQVEEFNKQSQRGTLATRFDQADFIRDSIKNMQQTGFYGMILAIFVLFVFLQNARSTLVIAISIPLAVLATMILIYFKGFTLNLVTMGGLTLGIGLLVDNSIVVIESIFRKLDDGLDPKEAAIEGTHEVASAILASTLTTLIVFVPLMFIEGRTGITLERMAWVVSFSLLCSLVSSITLTPMLTAYWLKKRTRRDPNRKWQPLRSLGRLAYFLVLPVHRLNHFTIRGAENFYRRTLKYCFRHGGVVAFLLFLAFSLSVGLMPRIGTEYFPETDEGDLLIIAKMASGIQVDQLEEKSHELGILISGGIKKILPEEQAKQIMIAATVGGDSDDAWDWNRAIFRVKLPRKSERSVGVEEIRKALADHLAEHVNELAGMKFWVRVNSQSAMKYMVAGGGNNGKLSIEILGHDLEQSETLAERLKNQMEEIPGLVNVDVNKQNRRAEMSVHIDRSKASLMGVSVRDIAQALETAVRGSQAIVFREEGDEYRVLVRLEQTDRAKITDIAQVGVRSANGAIIPLKNLVSFKHDDVPMMIYRYDKRRVIFVSSDIEDRDMGSAVQDLQKLISEMNVPDGYAIFIAGDWKEKQESFQALTFGLFLAVILMYMVMASQFESLKDPLMILIALPLGAIGVVLSLLITDTTLNVQSFIGLIILAGIVVNNAIVMIDYINQLRKRDPRADLEETILFAAGRRFRPIMMTTLTTILAMVPISMGWGEGSEIQAPMARVVIGGLLSGTLITMLAIPLIYRFVYHLNWKTAPAATKPLVTSPNPVEV